MPFPSLPTLPSIPSLGGAADRALAGTLPTGASGLSGLEEEDELSLLRSVGGGIAGGAASGLGAVGNLLGLPVSMVLDIASGENPFDQLLHPFSDVDRTYGRDFLRKKGLVGKEDTWGNFFAGMALEVGADPLSWMTRSPIFAGGKALRMLRKADMIDDLRKMLPGKKMGLREALMTTSPEEILKKASHPGSDIGKRWSQAVISEGLEGPANREARKRLLKEPAGKLLGVNPPLMEPMFGFGGGTKSRAIARKMDWAEDAFKSLPGIRHARALFDPRVGGSVSRFLQKRVPGMRTAQQRGVSDVLRKWSPILRMAKKSGVFDPDRNPKALEYSNAVYDYVEEIGLPKVSLFKELPPELEVYREHLDEMKRDFAISRELEEKAGLKASKLEDPLLGVKGKGDTFLEYAPHLRNRLHGPLSEVSKKGKKRARRIVDAVVPSDYRREDPLRGHHGGMSFLNRISIDGNISGQAHLTDFARGKKPEIDKQMSKWIDYVWEKYHEDMFGGESNQRRLAGELPSKLKKEQRAKTRKLVTFMANLDPGHAKNQIPMFETDIFVSGINRLEQSARGRSSAELITDALADDLLERSASELAGYVGPAVREMETLSNALTRLELKGKLSKENVVKRLLQDERLQKKFEDTISSSKKPPASLTGDDIAKGVRVSKDLVDDLIRYSSSFQVPEALAPFLEVLDTFTNLFKVGVTSLFPAFHFRNFYSGQYQNWVGGAADTRYSALNPMRWVMPILDAHNLATGQFGRISDILSIPVVRQAGIKNKDDAVALLQDLIYSEGVYGPHTHLAGEIVGKTPFGIEAAMPGMQETPGLRGTIFTPGPEGATKLQKTFGIAGVGGAVEDINPLVRAGKNVSGYVEQLNRISPFIAYLRQGMSPRSAAKKVSRLQVDYSNLTQFERGVMRRAIPFYSFSRGILPWTVEELMSRPGGRLSKTIQTGERARRPDELTPDYVAGTISIPWPYGAEEGTDRYVTGLGLMYEDPIQFFSLDIQDTLLEIASRMNPAGKGIAEYASGQSFFQRGPTGGRLLEDLDPTVGRTITNVSDWMAGRTGPGERTREAAETPLEMELALSNSPLARLLTSIRTGTDPRKKAGAKLTNLLTGVKITDVSPAAQDRIKLERAQELMKSMGGKAFRKVYFTKEEKAMMTPERLAEAELLQNLMTQLAMRGKERKAERLRLTRGGVE